MDDVDRAMGVAANIDWLTVTASQRSLREQLYEFAMDQFSGARMNSETLQPWQFLDYKGHTIEGFRWGTRQKDDVVIVSGRYADRVWRVLLPLADRCSRLDLAVTCSLAEPREGLAQQEYFKIQQNKDAMKDRRRTYTLVSGTPGGQTLYVGSRKNCQFGRLYDKGMLLQQIMMPGWLWRYEVELKKPLSMKVAAQLLQRPDNTDVTSAIRSTVHRWFDAREIFPIFPQQSESDWMDLLVEMRMSSDDITLSWLNKQVRPAVTRLVSSGKAELVSKALGVPVSR